MSTSARVSLDTTGRLVQAVTLLKIITRLICDETMDSSILHDILSAMEPYSRPFHLTNCGALL